MSTTPAHDLTAREREVALLVAYGYTNAEIGERLSISVRTVEMHRQYALRRLELRTRAQLVRWALDNDLLV